MQEPAACPGCDVLVIMVCGIGRVLGLCSSAEPDLSYAVYCDRTNTPWRSTQQGELAWTADQAERRRRGETDEDPFEAYNPFRQGRH